MPQRPSEAWPISSLGLALFCHFEGENPRGNSDDLYSRTYGIVCDSLSPHPTRVVVASPCRGLSALPLTLPDYGCSVIESTSKTWLARVHSSWGSTWRGLTYSPADHPGGSPSKGLSHITDDSAYSSYSLTRDGQSTRPSGEPGGQFAPILPDFADRCVAPPARGHIHPCWPKVAPKLSLRRPSSSVSGFSIRPQQEGRAIDVLLSPPQRHMLSMSAVPLNRFKVHGPWASFIRLALRYSINLGGCVPPPEVGAGATPSRWLEVIPSTTV